MPALHSIQCTNCGSPLSRENFDRRRAILDCASCGSVHDLYKPAYRHARINGELIDQILASQTELVSAKRTLSYQPKSFKTSDRNGRLTIEFPVGDHMWPFVTGVGLLIIFVTLGMWGRYTWVVPVVMLLLWMAVGWGLLKKRIGVSVTEDALTLTQSGLFKRKNHTLPASKIRQLFVQQQTFAPDLIAKTIASSMNQKATRDQSEEQPAWSVRMLTSNDTIVDLINSLPTREEALFLEQEIELRLGVRDAPVGGEVTL